MDAMEEIAQLLDQCKPEELDDILASIEQTSTPAPIQPVPPPAPPPGGRPRPVRPGMKPAEVSSEGGVIGMDEIKQLLQDHSDSVMSEVRKMIPSISSGVMQSVDVATLSQALMERDQEVKALEARLSSLNADLSAKDRQVMELGGELDAVLREVRHRQLDLEFQQLKLEEKVRGNAELEQAQRALTARVEEASLNARHAALEADMGRYTPRGGNLRAQGSLPWTLRKNRLPAVGNSSGL
eukprot:TRINITY_DN77690_c0_g1_i1.p1 TRINITY_DN77690_c0_g1~~TRINITY_DN77690_c0_g1_i1.p1  ORF type:complete len:265 (-),score=66.87 TRINITY_DN77690_c0_g1_i1:154-873(-)